MADPDSTFGVVVVCGFFAWMLMGWLAVDWYMWHHVPRPCVHRVAWDGVYHGGETPDGVPPIPPLFRRPEPVAGRVDEYGRYETIYRVTSLPQYPLDFGEPTWGGEMVRTIQSQLYNNREI